MAASCSSSVLFKPIELNNDLDDAPEKEFEEVAVASSLAPPASAAGGRDLPEQFREALFDKHVDAGPYPRSRIDFLVLQMLGSFGEQDVERLRSSMAAMLAETRGVLLVASMCSGTDLIVPVLSQLVARVCQKFNFECDLKVVFSAENTSRSRIGSGRISAHRQRRSQSSPHAI